MINKSKIVKTITACVPGTACNFKCKYCYIGNCCDEDHRTPTKFLYSVEHMIKAFSPERLGGIADIIVIGNGETLLPPEVVPFIKGLLKQGHVVELATNLTLNDRVDELLNMSKENLSRLVMRPSFHYNELKRLNKIDDFFNNLNKFREAGSACIPFMVICNEYMPVLDEIKSLFQNKFGAMPQCTPTLTYEKKSDINRFGKVQTDPIITQELKNLIKEKFNSSIFDLCCDYLNVDPKQVFCYAGKYSFTVTLDNGNVQKCHCAPPEFSMFKDLNRSLDMEAIGSNCCINTCAMQYQFIAQGLLENCAEDLTHYSLVWKDRENYCNEEVKRLLNFNYLQENLKYTDSQKEQINKQVKDKYEEYNFKLLKPSLKNVIRYKIYKYFENELIKRKLIK